MGTLENFKRAVLSALRTDGAKTDEELAKEIGVAETRVTDARESLESMGAIESYSAAIDPATVGFDTLSYHFVGAVDNYDETLEDGVPTYNMWEGTQLVMVVLGQYDLIIRKASRDAESFSRFAKNLIETTETPGFTRRESYRVDERYRWNGQDISSSRQYSVPDPVEISELEREVLSVLLKNGRLRRKPEELSKRLDASPAAVVEAAERLEDESIITGYTVNVDLDSMGWNRAFLGLSAVQDGYEASVERLLDFDPLHIPYVVSGTGFNWSDIGVELVFESVEELDQLTDEVRIECDALESRTFLSTKVFQDDRSVPLD
jgi:Lrp/AsnC family leucine-responsive transcriptional regulator